MSLFTIVILVILYLTPVIQCLHFVQNSSYDFDYNNLLSNDLNSTGSTEGSVSPDITDYLTQDSIRGKVDVNWTLHADTLCPHYSVCKNTSGNHAVPWSLDDESCCQPCECSKLCRTSNCCSRLTTPDELIPCQNQFELFNKPRGLPDVYNIHYYIIDTCHKDFSDEGTVQACYTPKSILDLVIVLDEVNGRLYKNGNCARCNHVPTFKYWELVAIINGSFINMDVYQFQQRILSEAAVYSRPSSNMDKYLHVVEINRCFPNSIDKCNFTGLWNYYDRELETACLQSGKTLFVGTTGYFFDYVYTNVFCFLCNQESRSSYQRDDTCPSLLDFHVDYSMETQVKAVMDVEKFTHILAKETKAYPCEINEVFVHYMEKCRVLDCPIGSTAVLGTCDTSVLLIDGLPVTFTFVLNMKKTPRFHNTGRQYFRDLYEAIIKGFDLAFLVSNCSFCEQIFYSINQSSFIFMELTVLSGSMCKLSDITTGLSNLAKTTDVDISFKYNFQPVVFQADLVLDKVDHSRKELFRRTSFRSCGSAERRYLQSKFHCPNIQITENDIAELGDKLGTNVPEQVLQLSDKIMPPLNVSENEEITTFSNISSTTTLMRICLNDLILLLESTCLTSAGTCKESSVNSGAIITHGSSIAVAAAFIVTLTLSLITKFWTLPN